MNKLLVLLLTILVCSCANQKPRDVTFKPSTQVYKLYQREFFELDPSIAGHALVNEESLTLTFERAELKKRSSNSKFCGSGIRPGTRFTLEISRRSK